MKEEARTEAARAKAVAAAPKAANVRPRTNKAKATKEDVSQVVSGYGSDVVLAARRIKRIESKWSQLLLTTSTSTTPTSCRRSCNHPSADTCPERLRRLSAHPASYPYLSQLPSSFRAFFVVPTSTSISSFCRRLLLFLLLRTLHTLHPRGGGFSDSNSILLRSSIQAIIQADRRRGGSKGGGHRQGRAEVGRLAMAKVVDSACARRNRVSYS